MMVDAEQIRHALRSSLAMVEATTAEVGGGPTRANILVTNGDLLVALHGGQGMATRTLAGKNDAELIMGDDAALRRRTPEIAQMRFVMVASDFDDDRPPSSGPGGMHGRWKPVADRSFVTIGRAGEPHVEAL
jgi:hypothetical protein